VQLVSAAEAIIDVNFAKYPPNTPVSEFTEPYMTFSTNGLGIARSREKDLELYGGLTDLSITLSAPASQLQFNYDIIASCESKAFIQLFKSGVVVDTTEHCGGRGVYKKAVVFDKVLITLGGVRNSVDAFYLWNLQIVIPNPPASTAGPTLAPSIVPSAVPTFTALPAIHDVAPRGRTLINELNGKSLILLTGPDEKAAVISSFPSGTSVRVLRGPQLGQGLTWWRVRIYDLEGWILASLRIGNKQVETLIPYSPDTVMQSIAAASRAITSRPTVASYNARGVAHYNLRKYEEALADFNRALKLNPKQVQTLVNLAQVHIIQDQRDSAISILTSALLLAPKDASLYHYRAMSYWNLGNNNAALDDFSRAIELNGQFAIAYVNRGAVWMYAGNFNAALTDVSTAIRIDPFCGRAYLISGIVHYNLDNLTKAKDDLNRAIDLDSTNSDAYRYRALIAILQRSYDQALADFNRTIQLNPNNGLAYIDRGDLYFLLENYAAAIEDYKKALTIKDAANTCVACAYNGLGRAYYEQHNLDSAIESFTKAIEASPDFAEAYAGRAKAYQAKGDHKAAQADMERARALGWSGK
jgi:tetratricopeptide (TPR) repeat protein